MAEVEEPTLEMALEAPANEMAKGDEPAALDEAAMACAVAAALGDGALPPLESLTCQLCKTYFTEPVTLPCMHSFCKACLAKYNGRTAEEVEDDDDDEDEEDDENPAEGEADENDSGNAQGETESNNNKKKKGKKEPRAVHCPTCKDDLELTEEDASFLSEPFPNDRLTRIVKLLHESKILCQNCEATASEFRCTVCDAYTCEKCYQATHDAPIFKSHVPERLTHSEMRAAPKCESHPVTDVEYFCTDDEIGVCQACLLKGEFRGKDYTLVTEVRKQRQEEIEEGISEALVQRAKLTEGHKEIEQTLEELSENLDAQKSQVRENFAAIREALNKREAETIQALQDLHDSKKRVLDMQTTAIAREKARIEDGVSNINLVLNHSNDLEVIYLTYVLQNHIGALTNVPSTSPVDSGSGADPDHSPAVDADLPVVLSSKVPELVQAYASVPDASLIDAIIDGEADPSTLQSSSGTEEQQAMLRQVAGTNVDGAEYGCVLQ